MGHMRRLARSLARSLAGGVAPIVAAAGGIVVGSVMLRAFGVDPLSAYRAMLDGAVGSTDALVTTTLKAVPLVLVGTGICIAFRSGVINIGGEGQMIVGALTGVAVALAVPSTPRVLLVPAVLLAGAVGGGLWGAICGVLKAKYSVSEILSTIMLNIVALQLMNYLLRGPWLDTGQVGGLSKVPQTERLTHNADLPILFDGARLHAGVVVALIMPVIAYVVLWRTNVGFRLRAVGSNPRAARYAGIRVERSIVTALFLSGGMAGLAGAIAIFGSLSHRMITDGSAAGFTGMAGYNGIVAALFGMLSPLWTVFSSVVFGGLLVGANKLQRALQVSSSLVVALNGLLVVFVVSSERLRRWIRRRLDDQPTSQPESAPRTASNSAAEPVPSRTHHGSSGPPRSRRELLDE